MDNGLDKNPQAKWKFHFAWGFCYFFFVAFLDKTSYARLGSESLKAGGFANQMDQSPTLSRFSFPFSNHPTCRYPTRRHPCIGWRRTSRKFDFPHPANPFFRGSPRAFRMKIRALLDEWCYQSYGGIGTRDALCRCANSSTPTAFLPFLFAC